MVDNLVDFVDNVVLRTNGYYYIPRLLRESKLDLLSNDVVLVEVMGGVDKTITMGWEVWILRSRDSKSGGFGNAWGVRFPSNEDFGMYGWFYSTRDLAEKKLSSLIASERSDKIKELLK